MRISVPALLTATNRNNDTVMRIDNGDIINDEQMELYSINAQIADAR